MVDFQRISDEAILNALVQGIAYCVFSEGKKESVSDILIVQYNKTFAHYFQLEENPKEPINYKQYRNSSQVDYNLFYELGVKATETMQIEQFLHYSERLDVHFQIVYTPIDRYSFVLSLNNVSVELVDATEKEIILSSINNVIFVYDEYFRIINVYSNDTSALYLPKSEIINKRLIDLFPREFAEAGVESLKKAKETQSMQQLILKSPMPFDERVFMYQHRHIEVNKRDRYVTIGMDITKEIKVNEQLQSQSEQLDKFFSVNLNLLAIFDHRGNFVRVNKVWESILGYDIASFENKSVFDFIHPEDIVFSQKQLHRLANSEESLLFHNRYRTKAGDYRIFEWRASSGDNYIYGAARDITDEQILKEQLEYQVALFEIAIEGSEIGVWEYNALNNTTFFSKRWKKILGYEDHEVENDVEVMLDLLHPDDVDFFMERRKMIFSGEVNKHDVEFRMRHKSGSYLWIRSKAQGIYDETGKLVRMAGSHEDITDEKLAKNYLQKTYNRMNELAEHGRIILWEVSADGSLEYVNAMFETILGFEQKDVIGTKIYEYFDATYIDAFFKNVKPLIEAQDKLQDIEVPIFTKAKEKLWVLVNAHPKFDEDNVFKGFQGTMVDITPMKESQQALAESEEKYRLLTESVSDVLWIFDVADNKVIYSSRSIEILTGFSLDNRMETPISQIMTPLSFKGLNRLYLQTRAKFLENPDTQEPQFCDIELFKADGTTTWVELSFTYRYGDHNRVEVIGVGRDIQDRKMMEKQLEYLSYHDALTDLYNRSYYEQELKRLHVERSLPISIIMADINDLKLTNDTFGHVEGDRIIKHFADILKKSTRAEDIVARIGGDEFVVLLPQTNEAEVEMIVKRIRQFVEKEISGKIKLSAAIGYMTTNEVMESVEEIFMVAEEAMYQQKLRDKRSQEKDILKIIDTSFSERFPEAYALCQQMVSVVERMVENESFNKNQQDDIKSAAQYALVGLLSDDSLTLKHNTHRIAEHGYHILKNVPSFRDVADYVLALFENVDGSGKPHGLSGASIPFPSKVIRVVLDYFQLKNTGLDSSKIEKKLVKNANIVYDKKVLNLLIDVLKEENNEEI